MPLTTSGTTMEPTNNGTTPPVTPPRPRVDGGDRRRERIAGKRLHASERIAAASVELAAQTTQSSAAAREMADSMQEVSAVAEQSSAACQQILAAVGMLNGNLEDQRSSTERGSGLASDVREVLANARSELIALVESVGQAAQRQASSVERIGGLEKLAGEIGEIVQSVAGIADETNLLAINAAIEAARAREHGMGFAVVADEVRALAEVSERSAESVRELIDLVRSGVTEVSEAVRGSAERAQGELAKNDAISQGLAALAGQVDEIVRGAADIAAAAGQSSLASVEVRRMTEEIAAAAEEQSMSITEALKMVEQQAIGLDQAQRAAGLLSEIAEELKGAGDSTLTADEVASAAQELSAGSEEITRSAIQILQVMDEIASAATMQAAKTQEASAALTQIDGGAQLSRERSAEAVERTAALVTGLGEIGLAIESMVGSIAAASDAARESVDKIVDLDDVSRRIDKIVDAIATVALQTNMLAVSGSVESARAGEYGRGFSAVSGDIRSLAKDSAGNAERIKTLVKAVQDRIAEVRTDLEGTSRVALAEVARVQQTNTRLHDVNRDLDALKAETDASRLAADDIVVAVSQVRSGMSSIASAATQAQNAAEQSREAATLQRRSADDVGEAIEEIASLAEELQGS